MKLGIDFGTSYSLPAVIQDGKAQILLSRGQYGIPSVFYYDSWEDVLIGEQAEEAGQGNSAKNLKREIKMDLNSTFIADGKVFTAKQIVGYILKNVKDAALDTANMQLLNDTIDGVVLSVPVAFSYSEKEILKEAAQLSEDEGGPELPLVGLIKEPVAAALAYFHSSLENKTRILVYDLGGGTCDIAIVEADDTKKERYRVIDSDMCRIGGKDWDEKLIPYIAGEIEKKTGVSSFSSPALQEKIKRAAVSAKMAFSEKQKGKYRDKVRIRIEVDGEKVEISLTRSMFDELTIGLFNKTMHLVKELRKRNPDAISKIICVGGGSKMPQVQEGLKRAFPSEEFHIFEPENAIAIGAAIYAELLGEERDSLKDIAQYAYGIRSCRDFDKDPEDEILCNLIRKGDDLPASGKLTFRTTEDNQKSALIELYETDTEEVEIEYPKGMEPVLSMEFFLPENCKKGTELSIQVLLNKDGLLEVTATDVSGKTCHAERRLSISGSG